MIEKYDPYSFFNVHTLRITFNHEGYVGHIAYELGGNCKGLDIICRAADFFEECDKDDIKKLVENDCELSFDFDYEDEAAFCLTLTKGSDKLMFNDITEDEVKEMVVSVEIVACEKED